MSYLLKSRFFIEKLLKIRQLAIIFEMSYIDIIRELTRKLSERKKIMKKSLFVLTTALLVSTSGFAADIYHPFYLPTKGGFLSDTSAVYQNLKNGKRENIVLAEGIAYGVTDKFAVTGTVADAWYLDTKGVTGHDRYDNPAWDVGVKYNLIDCPKSRVKVQVGANYTQGTMTMIPFPVLNDALTFDHHSKSFSGFVKAGFEVQEGFLPYVTGTVVKPVGKYEEQPTYIGRAGVYKTLATNLAADVGVDYAWSSAKDEDDGHGKVLALDGILNYKLSENTSVGLTGSYVLDVKPGDCDYYTVGVNFKWAF